MATPSKFTAGHLRAAMAGLFSLALIAGFFMGKIDSEIFIPIAVAPITYYFAKKQDDTQSEALALATKDETKKTS